MTRLNDTGRERLLAASGVLAALAASTCCIVPLVFVSIGISGAWIGALTRLAPYQPIFLAISALCIVAGFRSVYGRSQEACSEPFCGTPASRAATKAALWAGALIVVAAASAEWWGYLLA
jgi:mercuric ion transport protein